MVSWRYQKTRSKMATFNFNLRGVPSELMNLLKSEAEKLNTSVNALILKIIEGRFGLVQDKPVYHDLDHLASTWSSSEEKAFEENTRYFEKIDEEFWS